MFKETASDSVAERLVHSPLFLACACCLYLVFLADDAVVLRGIALGLHESPTKKRRVTLTQNPAYVERAASREVDPALAKRCI